MAGIWTEREAAIVNNKHFSKPGIVTIAGKPSDDIRKGTENSIIKQAGLK